MEKFIVSPSPHLRDKRTTRSLMLDVLIALAPAVAAAGILFGPHALLLIAVCTAACVLMEWALCRVCHLDNPIGDLSAAVTGVILACNLPPELPVWMALLGCFFAIVVAKGAFGGIGQNFANPALVGRIVLFVSFSSAMTTWVKPFSYRYGTVHALATATPLAQLRAGRWTEYRDLFLGTIGGCLGETCALALLLGGLYLCVRRVIHPATPLSFLATVALLAYLAGEDPLFHLLSGGLLFGAIYMATDYSTSPSTAWGRVLFGVGCGLITMVIRLFGAYTEGVSFAILLMNILSPYLEQATMPKVLGGAAS